LRTVDLAFEYELNAQLFGGNGAFALNGQKAVFPANEPVRVVPEEVKRGGFASLAASPEAERLREYLQTPPLVTGRGSIFDLPPLNLGRMLRSLDADDDLLSEMLDDARF
jgi:hypothetical protein